MERTSGTKTKMAKMMSAGDKYRSASKKRLMLRRCGPDKPNGERGANEDLLAGAKLE
jgi:hypothetical protein